MLSIRSSTVLLLLQLLPLAAAYGPCAGPYAQPQPLFGGAGCRGGGGYNQWRGVQYPAAGYGVQYPGVRYGTPYAGNVYAGQVPAPPPGGSYATAPHVAPVAPEPFVHPTQSTPTDHSTAMSAGEIATTTDELADIFDEFKGRDEEELLTGGGRLRSDTSPNSNLFLTPLQPPGRNTPYKPEISASHDEKLTASQISKDLISESTITDSKTGFIPQSKPLPASFTQTSAVDAKDPFSESAGM
ncbi:hypothetical protein PFISCL1PPCAC_3609, partial [Pristionchus fissidentatus]